MTNLSCARNEIRTRNFRFSAWKRASKKNRQEHCWRHPIESSSYTSLFVCGLNIDQWPLETTWTRQLDIVQDGMPLDHLASYSNAHDNFWREYVFKIDIVKRCVTIYCHKFDHKQAQTCRTARIRTIKISTSHVNVFTSNESGRPDLVDFFSFILKAF